jgi:hypothetical protein
MFWIMLAVPRTCIGMDMHRANVLRRPALVLSSVVTRTAHSAAVMPRLGYIGAYRQRSGEVDVQIRAMATGRFSRSLYTSPYRAWPCR